MRSGRKFVNFYIPAVVKWGIRVGRVVTWQLRL